MTPRQMRIKGLDRKIGFDDKRIRRDTAGWCMWDKNAAKRV